MQWTWSHNYLYTNLTLYYIHKWNTIIKYQYETTITKLGIKQQNSVQLGVTHFNSWLSY